MTSEELFAKVQGLVDDLRKDPVLSQWLDETRKIAPSKRRQIARPIDLQNLRIQPNTYIVYSRGDDDHRD